MHFATCNRYDKIIKCNQVRTHFAKRRQAVNTVKFNSEKTLGRIKPMHAVNNGPARFGGSDNFDAFREAGIPFARTHDASFFAGYGGYHTVDIHAIFPDFDADVNDEASYDFACTDKYLSEIDSVGAEVFYRLGTKIEHEVKKYNIFAPKDPLKWAQICEHIIRHYTEGWANGFYYKITYWEIWNEPDLDNKCWIGTDEQFFELYTLTSKHLKACFPDLKIGGPAVTGPKKTYNEMFIKYVSENVGVLDFFSYHCYGTSPEDYARRIGDINTLLDKYGIKCEKILNEWNYVKAWSGPDYVYSIKLHQSSKCAAFVGSVMVTGQESDLDMLMYYDARPNTFWNGMFNTWAEKCKPYYPFYFFNKLYVMGNETETVIDGENIYAISAKGESGKKGFFIVAYNDDDDAENEITYKTEISGLSGTCKASFYLTDSKNDGVLIKEELTSADTYCTILTVEKNSLVYIEIEEI